MLTSNIRTKDFEYQISFPTFQWWMVEVRGMVGDDDTQTGILCHQQSYILMFKVPPFWPDLASIPLPHVGAFRDSVS